MASSNIVIDSILTAERKADQIIANAKENAQKILSDSDGKAEQIRQKALEDYKNDVASNLKHSEEECLKSYNTSLDEVRETANNMIADVNKNLDKVVEYLVKRVK